MLLKTDLRPHLGPVRDQGQRPTCLAFALSAAHERHHNRVDPLSPEWLYYHTIQRTGDPVDAGLFADDAIKTLSADGQPEDAFWPYRTDPPSSTWGPPADAPSKLFEAEANCTGLRVDDVIAALDDCRLVVFTLLIDETLFSWRDVGSEVVIEDAPAPYDPQSCHALVAVGHGTVDRERAILIRNSWGRTWGREGYALLPEEYLKARSNSTIFLTEK
ncbi:C1 family peptidase [Pyruvatibacter sp.]|uniref:C1 family peptidase n=1 Tax=Pyruvatibacter sp. TaxID=1981328 RepID=UPI003267AE81